MAKLSFDDGDGVWRTVGGKHIFIRTGESLSSAMKKSGKFKSAKKKSTTKDETKKFSDDELNEKYAEKKEQMENWLDETNDGKLNKYEEEALKYEREKHGEKAYQDLKKEFERGDDTFRKASASDSNDKEEEKKKIGGWRINEQGKKEYYERELANNERGYWTKENGQRVFKENPNYKENSKEKGKNISMKEAKNRLNFSQRQRELGERLNEKARNMARDDIKTYLKGNKENWDSDGDFIRDLANEYGLETDEAKKMFNDTKRTDLETKYQKYVNDTLNNDEYLEKNMPAGARFSKMLEESNVKTFADEIKEQNKIETISKAEYDKMPNDYKGTLKELVETAEFRGENKQDLIKQYEKMGYDVNKDKTILVNEKGGTVLKPVKISDNNEKYSVDYFKQRGVEIKDSVPEGYVKLEGATTAPKGYEWYSNGKSRFGGEYKNALVKKEENGTQSNDKFYTKKDGTKVYDPYKGTPYERKYDSLKDVIDDKDSKLNQYINEKIRRKAYQKYLREHPASKITFEDFKDMRNINK